MKRKALFILIKNVIERNIIKFLILSPGIVTSICVFISINFLAKDFPITHNLLLSLILGVLAEYLFGLVMYLFTLIYSKISSLKDEYENILNRLHTENK